MHQIYGTYVDALMQTEAKRQAANQVYMTISLAVLTIFSTVTTLEPRLIALMLALVGVTWIVTILWYRALAKTKYQILLDLETHLEYNPFTREWEAFSNAGKVFGLTRLELISPLVMLVIAAEISFNIWERWV